MEVDNILNNYLKITSIINNMSRPQKTLKKTRIKLCNTIALTALLKGSENWTIKARDARRITAAEIGYMWKTAGYTWTDYKTNTKCKRTKHNPSFGQNTGIQKKLVATYTGCPRRNVPDLGRVFLMLKYTDITQNTYVQSWTVTEIMTREKCGLLAGPRTVPVSWQANLCYGVECGIILQQFSSGQP